MKALDAIGAPFRWIAGLFPFSFSGRQTLIYVVFAGAGPALTLVAIWTMRQSLANKLFNEFTRLADTVSLCLLITTMGLAMFVSIRSLKIGRDGIEAAADPTDRTVAETGDADGK